MDVPYTVGLLLAVIFNAATIEANLCKHDSDCVSGHQCCYIRPEFMVVSRRQLQPINLPGVMYIHNDTGVCENYKVLGDHCSVFEKMNKHCSCGYGTSCRWVDQLPTVSAPHVYIHPAAPHRRSMIHPPGYGAYKCAL